MSYRDKSDSESMRVSTQFSYNDFKFLLVEILIHKFLAIQSLYFNEMNDTDKQWK